MRDYRSGDDGLLRSLRPGIVGGYLIALITFFLCVCMCGIGSFRADVNKNFITLITVKIYGLCTVAIFDILILFKQFRFMFAESD